MFNNLTQSKKDNIFCEICGEPTKKRIIRIIEGTEMIVCPNCVEYGDEPPKKYSNNSKNKEKSVIKSTKVIQNSVINIPNKKQISIDKKITKKPQIEDLELKKDYKKILIKLRQSKNMTQAEFANSVGISLSLLKNVENNKMDLTIPDAQKIEKKYNIKLTQEISSEEDEIVPTQFMIRKEDYTLGDVFFERKKKKS